MLFTRTHEYLFNLPKEHLKYRLIGNCVKIHNLDFEVYEKEHAVHIIPHADNLTSIKTLPVTRVAMSEEGNKTKVVITSHMRKIDSGGPFLIIIFCLFLAIASCVLLYVGSEPLISYALGGASVVIFLLFMISMQMGYFDYIRKIRAYIKFKGDQITTDVRQQIFKHKVT
jgi:hypothetical protein